MGRKSEVTKYCPMCGEVLSADEFHFSSYNKYGIATYCKECENARCRLKYKESKRRKILSLLLESEPEKILFFNDFLHKYDIPQSEKVIRFQNEKYLALVFEFED